MQFLMFILKILLKDLSTKFKTKYSEDGLQKAESNLGNTKHVVAIVAVFPHKIGILSKNSVCV